MDKSDWYLYTIYICVFYKIPQVLRGVSVRLYASHQPPFAEAMDLIHCRYVVPGRFRRGTNE